MAVLLLSANICVTETYAMDIPMEHQEIRESIQEATRLIEEVFNEQYQKKKETLLSIIQEKGYDSTMTLQSFYEQKNVFKDVDYIQLISTYGTIKEYYQTHHIPLNRTLKDIPFLKMELEEKWIEETNPILIEKYKEEEEGVYVLCGNQMITEETIVPVFLETEDGLYEKVGEEILLPPLIRTPYAEISLSLISYEEILSLYQLTQEEIETPLTFRESTLASAIQEEALNQSVFIQNRQDIETICEISVEEMQRLLAESGSAKDILDIAVSLIGQVPYQWGGKPAQAGYDKTWWTFENNEQKGLDCSGFVKWVFMTAGYQEELTDSLSSTAAMMKLESIGKEDLEPGDLGLLNYGETTNHVGIYMGDGFFIHCASEQNTVVVDTFPFTHFKRVNYLNADIDTATLLVYYTNNIPIVINTKHVEPEEVLLLAQLLEHEAGNQGYNGMVAVGEVVMNRIASENFPDTLREVLYQESQFSHVENISSIEPREETKLVAEDILKGNIKIFNNQDVLYFRNPMITSGISASVMEDWGNKKWYTYVLDTAFYISQ